MFDEGEKELTIFIPAASDGIGEEARRDGVFQSRQRRRGKKAGRKGGREEDESGWELRRAGRQGERGFRGTAKGTGAKGESVSCCTSRYGELAKRLQRQAFRRLRWCSNSPM